MLRKSDGTFGPFFFLLGYFIIFSSLPSQVNVPTDLDGGELLAEKADRREFIDLLKRMLTMDQERRIVPSEGLYHAFVSLSHLVDYAHCSNVKASLAMMDVCKRNHNNNNASSSSSAAAAAAAAAAMAAAAGQQHHHQNHQRLVELFWPGLAAAAAGNGGRQLSQAGLLNWRLKFIADPIGNRKTYGIDNKF